MIDNFGGVQIPHFHNLLGFGYVESHTELTQGAVWQRLVVRQECLSTKGNSVF